MCASTIPSCTYGAQEQMHALSFMGASRVLWSPVLLELPEKLCFHVRMSPVPLMT
ncbi:hypothetical protein Mapa_006775 [Marchantia paleacea]|nr:hypothetical protein Mapa_006775 [Marchantia paleacea]